MALGHWDAGSRLERRQLQDLAANEVDTSLMAPQTTQSKSRDFAVACPGTAVMLVAVKLGNTYE
jgi:hypothetical protein